MIFQRFCVFVAAEDDMLEEENGIFVIDICLRDEEQVVEKEVSEVVGIVTLPVFDTLLQGLRCPNALCTALCLVDSVSNPTRHDESLGELGTLRILFLRSILRKRLKGGVNGRNTTKAGHLTSKIRGYLHTRGTGFIMKAGSSDRA
jgi:hypothetical protein